MHVQEMIRTHPQPPVVDRDALARCIDACFDCAQSCVACAGACLGEAEHVQRLARCIRLDQDCAEICEVTGNILSRGFQPDPDVIARQLAACIVVCERCAQECNRHASEHEHCRVCAVACRQCLEACQIVAGQLDGHRIAAATH